VTLATLAGVLAIYVLVGMFSSFAYGVIAAVDEGALYTRESEPNGGTSSTPAS
jgi:hypothetical protein